MEYEVFTDWLEKEGRGKMKYLDYGMPFLFVVVMIIDCQNDE